MGLISTIAKSCLACICCDELPPNEQAFSSPTINMGRFRPDHFPLNGATPSGFHGRSAYPIVRGNQRGYRPSENNNFQFDLLGARDNLRGVPRGLSTPYPDFLSDLPGARGNLRTSTPNPRPSVLDTFPDLLTARDDLRMVEPYERPSRLVNPGRNGLYGSDLRPVSQVLKKRVYGSFRQGNYWVTDYGS